MTKTVLLTSAAAVAIPVLAALADSPALPDRCAFDLKAVSKRIFESDGSSNLATNPNFREAEDPTSPTRWYRMATSFYGMRDAEAAELRKKVESLVSISLTGGMASIVVMGILVSLVVTTVTVLNGFSAATDEKQLLMRTLGATKLQIFTKVVLPAGVPDLISALKISVGMSWVGVIVGEYLVSKAGLGYLIVYGGQVFKLDLVMASVTVLCILAALMYYAVAFLEKKVRT